MPVVTNNTASGAPTLVTMRPPFRKALTALLRAIASTAVLVTIYYLLPLDRSSVPVAATELVVGLVALVVLIGFQVRSIMRSPFPGLRAVEALSTSIPLFLLLFASTYLVMSSISNRNFSQPLTHTAPLYFAVTIFSTVGFGDIVANTDSARLVVMGQMISDVVIIGIGAKIVIDAVTHARQRRLQSPGVAQP
jgi:hypothetical protein